ncbi:hypothetical protein L596_008894 [Steinernema carpocapsae]|uniref:BTB domain-containing protein n=1 Tax=Steinernema carpocapsae TaxID=34508 RepID=A0A4U5PDV3_STECR|nr:hypothetical protein L596_008894 [Steinernema carpocapsae]
MDDKTKKMAMRNEPTKVQLVANVADPQIDMKMAHIGDFDWIFSHELDIRQEQSFLTVTVAEPANSLWCTEFMIFVEIFVLPQSKEIHFYHQSVHKLKSQDDSVSIGLITKSNYPNFVSDDRFEIAMSVIVGRSWKDDLGTKTPFGSQLVVIGDRELYVSGPLLCLHSNFFRVMLNSDFLERQSGRCILHDIDYDNFLLFLFLIYPVDCEITEDNVDRILKFADQFDCHFLARKCTTFLGASSMPPAQSLLLADTYNLPGLTSQIVCNLSSSEIYKMNTRGPAAGHFPDRLKILLFDRLASYKKNSDLAHIPASDTVMYEPCTNSPDPKVDYKYLCPSFYARNTTYTLGMLP